MIYPDSFERKIGFDAVRQRLDRLCLTGSGREHVNAMAFMTGFDAVSRAVGATAEMLAVLGGDTDFPLGGLHDISAPVKRSLVSGAVVSAEEFRAIRRTIATIGEAVAFLAASRNDDGTTPYPILCDEGHDLEAFPVLAREIDRVVDAGGNVLDTASPQLAKIRSELARVSATVNSILRRVMSRAVSEGYLESDATPAVRDGRLVVPVSPMNKRRIPGIVHDESASGKTYFIEPAEVVEVNNRVRELELDERREIARILAELTAVLGTYATPLMVSATKMGWFDFVHAKARYARETDAVMPHLAPAPELEWYRAVHPVLLESLRQRNLSVVPLDITLSAENRILVISGPNAGGKSVTLKTVGIVQYMLQCGLIPTVAENSHMGIFDDIFVDIGDDQSIENDLSTYSSHLANMRRFVTSGRDTSLMLIDEFGGGTDPQMGGAIAQAILGELNARGMWGIITTHYHNLKQFASETPGLINGSMLYDRQKMQPLFRLSIGTPGSSFALEIARKAGLPGTIIDRAEELVGSEYVNLDKYLLDIARDRRYWENKRQAIKLKERKIEATLQRYEADADNLRQHRCEILAEAKEEARKVLEGSNASIERAIREIREAQADKERTREARRQLDAEKKALMTDKPSENALLRRAPKTKKKTEKTEPAPADTRPLAVGDNVLLDGAGTPGKILEISGKQATVAFGMLKTQVKLNRLKRTMKSPPGLRQGGLATTPTTVVSTGSSALDFSTQLDVRGMRADEAIQAVTYFIDDAIRYSQPTVRILHGTGTGALRLAVRQYLDTVSGVRSFRDEDVRFGGAGITVVTLD